jgi:hypothetical protein
MRVRGAVSLLPVCPPKWFISPYFRLTSTWRNAGKRLSRLLQAYVFVRLSLCSVLRRRQQQHRRRAIPSLHCALCERLQAEKFPNESKTAASLWRSVKGCSTVGEALALSFSVVLSAPTFLCSSLPFVLSSCSACFGVSLADTSANIRKHTPRWVELPLVPICAVGFALRLFDHVQDPAAGAVGGHPGRP